MASSRRAHLLAPALLTAIVLASGSSGCLLIHHKPVANPLSEVKSQQPDKLLYDIAMKDISKGKYTVARLNLETLLNTYPNSEYLAQAKLALANSWYQQGGAEGYAQAEAQYKDFITFFPAMQEASEAQLRIAQIHFKQLQKPDRDPTQALQAQAALRTFLMNYPDSPLRPQALQMLRDTQEVLAERIYLIGQYYLDRAHQGTYADYRAAQSRLEETQTKFPLYSQGDVLTDELAQSYATTSKLYADAATVEHDKTDHELYTANAQSDRARAVAEFSHLIERYPLSPLAKDAKAQLTALKAPIPTPTQQAIVFNRDEIAGREKAPDPHGMAGWFGIKSMWTGRPAMQLARADKVGNPPLNEASNPPTPPLPGLREVIHQTMVASGAIPANASTTITAAMTEAGRIHDAGQGADPAPTATAEAKPAPLAFQNVPTEKARGADTLPTDTPQAMTGNNFTDPNATAPAPAVDPNIVLTPNEIDMETRLEMLADGIHRDVPAPLAELKKGMRRQEQAQQKMLRQIREEELKHEKTDKHPGATAPAAKPPAPAPATPQGGKQ